MLHRHAVGQDHATFERPERFGGRQREHDISRAASSDHPLGPTIRAGMRHQRELIGIRSPADYEAALGVDGLLEVAIGPRRHLVQVERHDRVGDRPALRVEHSTRAEERVRDAHQHAEVVLVARNARRAARRLRERAAHSPSGLVRSPPDERDIRYGTWLPRPYRDEREHSAVRVGLEAQETVSVRGLVAVEVRNPTRVDEGIGEFVDELRAEERIETFQRHVDTHQVTDGTRRVDPTPLELRAFEFGVGDERERCPDVPEGGGTVLTRHFNAFVEREREWPRERRVRVSREPECQRHAEQFAVRVGRTHLERRGVFDDEPQRFGLKLRERELDELRLATGQWQADPKLCVLVTPSLEPLEQCEARLVGEHGSIEAPGVELGREQRHCGFACRVPGAVDDDDRDARRVDDFDDELGCRR
ncbi:MAG: hypothetical protein IT453_07450 [Planctomycetes bacterium]|nr:hypothetical protein [Planctomycetota bacterium]